MKARWLYIKEFRLYNEVISFSKYIRRYVIGDITSIHRDLRIHLLDEIYNLKRDLISAINNKGNIRSKNINDMLISIAMIDIIIDEIRDYNKSKHIDKSIGMITNIKGMILGWRKTIEESD